VISKLCEQTCEGKIWCGLASQRHLRGVWRGGALQFGQQEHVGEKKQILEKSDSLSS
jgi:hypothetical protein